MLRWGAEIVGYELREDFANRARANVRSFLGDGALERYRVELRDCYEGIDERERRPGRARPARAVAGGAARREGAGAPAASSSPTRRRIMQVTQLREALAGGPWVGPRTLEVLHRGWHVEGRRCGPTTAWSPTPASSPPPDS